MLLHHRRIIFHPHTHKYIHTYVHNIYTWVREKTLPNLIIKRIDKKMINIKKNNNNMFINPFQSSADDLLIKCEREGKLM